ncbi:TPA: hypothetical protein HA361_06225 [Candidatus Woesearchaeota archaeon]|nr:hypothetical protein [Candidatus Woesearchaeota archaeon]
MMNKSVVLVGLVAILLAAFASAADLSSFPDSFIANDKFDAYIVVGDHASATDVIAQTSLALILGSYIGAPQSGITKLASEGSVSDDMVLIGNPCVNGLTAEVLGNPNPCHEGFEDGKAVIRMVEADGKNYIIAAGYDAPGNKIAVDYLAGFEEHGLSGSEIVIDAPAAETEQDVLAEGRQISDAKEEDSAEESPEIVQELTEPGVAQEPEKQPEAQEQAPLPEEQRPDANFIGKLWLWLVGLLN